MSPSHEPSKIDENLLEKRVVRAEALISISEMGSGACAPSLVGGAVFFFPSPLAST